MNLHGIVSGVIGAVNPHEPLSVRASTGYTTNANRIRVPTYAAAVTVPGQVQSLTFGDIQQLDSLNIQGTRRAIYLYGQINGLVRVSSKGGDLITRANGTVWLVALVLEQWPDWCKLAATLQDGS